MSWLKTRGYCHGVHAATAGAFGIPEDTLSALLAAVGTSPVPRRMKPLLRYAAKLTLTRRGLPRQMPRRCRPAGFQEQALHAAVAVCGLPSMMNRLVAGPGITARKDYFRTAADQLSETGYAARKKIL
jgi:alkylhydroperoxidase family enzyme